MHLDYTIFTRLLTYYPTGCLISELLQIYEGKFVVRASVQVDGVTRATGMACAETLELAEDRARSRALMVLLPDASVQPELPPRYPSVMTEAQPVVKPSLPDSGTDNKQPSDNAPPSGWNNSTISSLPEVQAIDASESAQNGLPQLAVENYGAQSAAAAAAVTPVTPVAAADAEVGGDKSTRKYDTQQEFESEVVIPFGDEEFSYSSDYNYDENIPLPESEPKLKPKLKPAQESNEPFDLSDAIAQTSIQLKRLSWSTQHGRKYLEETYGKRSRHDLSDTELLSFLSYLESQPTPNQLPLE